MSTTMKFALQLALATCLLVALTVAANQLESVSDDELVHMIKNDEFVVVLFCEYYSVLNCLYSKY